MNVTSRVWELVTNLKDDNGDDYITLNWIDSVLKSRTIERKGSIKEYAYIVHDKDVYTQEKILKEMPELEGTHKKDHVHVVMRFSYAQELERLVEWFDIPANFFEKGMGRGAWEEKLMYLTHEDDKQQALGKYLYPDEEVVANFNFRKTINEYKAKKLKMKSKYGKTHLSAKEMLRMDLLKGGLTLSEVMEKDPVGFSNDYSTLIKMRHFYLSQQEPPHFRLNLYIEGSGGVGKDLMARAIARSLYPEKSNYNDIIFSVGSAGAEFEGYDGEPVVIWSDVRAGELISRFGRKNVLEGILEPFQGEVRRRQNVKYSSTCLINAVNIFTGADKWNTFLNGLVGEYTDRTGKSYRAENKNQSYRRFPLIIPVTQSRFDIMLNEGFMKDNDNWMQYFIYKSVTGSFAKAHSKLPKKSEKINKVQEKMCEHFVEVIDEVNEKVEQKELTDEEFEREFGNYGELLPVEEAARELGLDKINN